MEIKVGNSAQFSGEALVQYYLKMLQETGRKPSVYQPYDEFIQGCLLLEWPVAQINRAIARSGGPVRSDNALRHYLKHREGRIAAIKRQDEWAGIQRPADFDYTKCPGFTGDHTEVARWMAQREEERRAAELAGAKPEAERDEVQEFLTDLLKKAKKQEEKVFPKN